MIITESAERILRLNGPTSQSGDEYQWLELELLVKREGKWESKAIRFSRDELTQVWEARRG